DAEGAPASADNGVREMAAWRQNLRSGRIVHWPLFLIRFLFLIILPFLDPSLLFKQFGMLGCGRLELAIQFGCLLVQAVDSDASLRCSPLGLFCLLVGRLAGQFGGAGRNL